MAALVVFVSEERDSLSFVVFNMLLWDKEDEGRVADFFIFQKN